MIKSPCRDCNRPEKTTDRSVCSGTCSELEKYNQRNPHDPLYKGGGDGTFRPSGDWGEPGTKGGRGHRHIN